MAPSGQSASWSDVLCCRICSELFSSKKLPINLACGHTICHTCLRELSTNNCPLDQAVITLPFEKLPPNLALLSILSEFIDIEPVICEQFCKEYQHIESTLVKLASYLHPVECLFGGSVWSDKLSKPMQRKLISLLCYQLMEYKGFQRALKTARAIAERALSELIIYHQDNSNISATLWSAIRSRGCQFLGPAMQEEVLKLIFLILSEGSLMSRKTLVLYIVQALREDYPQASKTCIGNVVQLLYRASCFNILKREGESSLMQLKTEFRNYDVLRREHDTQIVQVALEQGLRISPDQWSALLYGDQHHRSHMQSIIDKLHSRQDFEQQINDLKAVIEQSHEREMLTSTLEHFERFANFGYLNELPDWTLAVDLFDSLLFIIKAYVKFMRTKSTDKLVPTARYVRLNTCRQRDRSYKTRFSRNFTNLGDIAADHVYSTDLPCTYTFAKNGFRAPVQQMQLHTPSVVVERIPEDTVSSTAFSQLKMAKLPPLSTNGLPIWPLSTLRNIAFPGVEESPVNQNLMLPTQSVSAPSIPLIPLVIPEINCPVSSPLLPLAALIQVVVPESTGLPIGVTPIFPVSPPSLQIYPTKFGNISRSDYVNYEVCPVQYKVPMEPPDLSQIQNSIHRNDCEPKNRTVSGELSILRRRLRCPQPADGIGADVSADEGDLQSHVSYTVAKSVLYEDKELMSTTSLQLSPISLLQIASQRNKHCGNSSLKLASVLTYQGRHQRAFINVMYSAVRELLK